MLSTVLQEGGETALPIDAVGWAVLVLGAAITAAWLVYLFR